MKKFVLSVSVAFVLGLISIYVFIPGQFNISTAIVIPASENGTQRFALDKTHWPKWWNYSGDSTLPASKIQTDSFTMKGDVYILTESFYKSAKIIIRHKNQQVESNLMIIPLQIDSTGIEWKYSVTTSNNPFRRFSQYQEAKEIKKNMERVLSKLAAFLSRQDEVYGVHIERTSMKDTLLVSTKSVFSNYPGTSQIYQMVQKIQAFIKTKAATQTGNPIFNISETEKKQYQLMCAIPVDRVLTDNEAFVSKKMIKGSFMTAEVVGGDSTVKKASASLQQYFEDYRKTSMAINFTMLITDRIYQPDTTKWITRLYFPVY